MQIPLNVLLYRLAANSIYETLNIDLSESFSGLKLFDINSMLDTLDAPKRELYLITARDLQKKEDSIRAYNFNKSCVFFCMCDNEEIHVDQFSDSLSVILLYTKQSYVEIFNRILTIFHDFESWDKEFHLTLLRGGSMQDLLDLSKNILTHPMLILDNNFSLLGYFSSELIDDETMSEILTAGYVTPQAMLRLRQDGLISTSENAENPLINYYCITPTECYYSMMYRFQNNGHTVGYALVLRNKVHPKTNYLDLMNVVVENLNLYFQQKRFTDRSSSEIYESIFGEILSNSLSSRQQIEDQLTFVSGFSIEGRFMLAQLTYTNHSELPFSFVSWNIRNSFPSLKPFVYDNKMYILKVCTDQDSLSTFITTEEEGIFRRCFRSQNFLCSVSNMFFTLMELPIAARQCNETYFRHQTLSNDFQYFRDISLLFVLRELEKMELIDMIESPEYHVLKQYDMMHNNNLCDIFIEYLQSGHNVNQTATAVFLHRNTVLNKIKKAMSVMQCDFEDYQTQTAFILSYLADHK